MSQMISTDICVIGAGSGGLSVAAGASQMGARVVLVEKGEMGGECLNTGCVPSKALLAAAHAAHAARQAHRFGIQIAGPEVQMEQVHAHLQGVIGAIAPHDSQARFEKLGVQVIRAEAHFTGPREVIAGDYLIEARRVVVATGSHPALPAIAGLERVPFFTNENLFDNRQPLPHLLVLGGGPVAVELAQAYRRLGSQVTMLARTRLLKRDDAELVAVLQRQLAEEGITCRAGLDFEKVERSQDGGVVVEVTHGGERHRLAGSHLLVATGRRPNTERLQLAAANISVNEQGFIAVDPRLRTTNPRVYALGDVAGPHLFTHMAAYQAGIVVRNVLFRLPARVDYRGLAWVTYTDPEVAQVGLSEAQAKQAGLKVTVLRKEFAQNDRARTEGQAEGLIKVVVGPGGRILGAGIAGPHAGELIHSWSLAVSSRLTIGAMATAIAPYPTLSEISKGVAGSYYTPKLYGEGTRRLVRWLARLG